MFELKFALELMAFCGLAILGVCIIDQDDREQEKNGQYDYPSNW